MSDSKSSAASADWTHLLTDPDLVSHLGKLLKTYREAPPDKREQALMEAMREIQRTARPNTTISNLQAAARDTFRRAGGQGSEAVFIFFHGLGLEHIDMELTSSRQDWQLEAGMVVSAHLQVPGDDRTRSWLEEILLITPDGGEPFFSWCYEPLEN